MDNAQQWKKYDKKSQDGKRCRICGQFIEDTTGIAGTEEVKE